MARLNFKSHAVADKNGGANTGFFLVEDLLPQQIGDFNVTLCTQAVKILSKQEQSGKSKANDAAFELAAQLLAAKLNLAAGGETCTAVQTAVTKGQAMLANDPINFTGSGDYLGPKVKGATLTLRNQALSLATTLDRYNNGNLWPCARGWMQRGRICSSPTKIVRLGLLKVKADLESELGTLP